MGAAAFEQFIGSNEKNFEKELLKFETERKRRKDRREKKKSKQRAERHKNLKKRVVEFDDDSTDTDVSLAQRGRSVPSQDEMTRSRLPASQQSDSLYNSLFDHCQEKTQPHPVVQDELFIKDSQARKAPLEQSSSEDDEVIQKDPGDSGTDDSLLEEIRQKDRASKSLPMSKIIRRNTEPNVGSSLNLLTEVHESPRVRAPSTEQNNPGAESKCSEVVHRLERSRTLPATKVESTAQKFTSSTGNKSTETTPANDIAHEAGTRTKTINTSRRSDPTRLTTKVATTKPITTRAPRSFSNASKGPFIGTKKKINTTSNMPMIRKSGGSSAQPAAIKMTNQPFTKARKDWQTTDRHYNTLQFRRMAEKRSRNEQVPDFSALEFVGAKPADVATSRRETIDNPYDRRETTNRRVQSPEPVRNMRRASRGDFQALEDFEKPKAPLVCFAWRNGGCQYTAEKCNFLHRNQDNEGRDLSVGDVLGILPHKCRHPPITCPFWFQDPPNCTKSDKECDYAHRNTGWLPNPQNPGENRPISKDELPPPQKKSNKSSLTCAFWLRSPRGCSKPEHECKFQHRNTGEMLDVINGHKLIQIPLTQRPVFVKPKDRKPPITCRWWLSSRCERDPVECHYAHSNTGWVENSSGLPTQIASNKHIVSEQSVTQTMQQDQSMNSHRMDKSKLTCWYWATEGQTCMKSAEQCYFQHYDTGVLANRPPQMNASRTKEGRGLAGFNANLTPLGERPRGAEQEEPLDYAEADQLGPRSSPQRGPRRDSAERSIDCVMPDELLDLQMGQNPISAVQKTSHTLPVVSLTCSDVDGKLSKALGLEVYNLFAIPEKGDKKPKAHSAVLLFHPVDHIEELELITRWLLLHHVAVLNGWSDGFWDIFRAQMSDPAVTGTVIVS